MRVAMVLSTVGFHWEEVYDAFKEFKNTGWSIDFYTVDAANAVADPRSLEIRPILSFFGLGLRDSFSPETELGKEISYLARYEVQDISTMNVNALDAIYIAGGHGCLFDVNVNEQLHQKILEAYQKDKILSAVCHGTSTFAFVYDQGKPIVSGKRITGFPDFLDKLLLKFDLVHENYTPLPFSNEKKIKSAGAKITRFDIILSIINPFYHVIDPPFITGAGPKSAGMVARRVLKFYQRKQEEFNKAYEAQPAFG